MNPDEIAEAFDARAARYIHDDWHRRYAEQLVAVTPLRPGDRVLDAGTGTGFAACAIARRVGSAGSVVGVDLSEGMLVQARRLIDAAGLQNVEFLQGDVTDLVAQPAASFDAVVCSAGLLYMPISKALATFHRLLRPGGVLAFSTMQAGSPSAGRIFRECAAKFGMHLADRSEALGSEEHCRAVLVAARFECVRLIAARVDFESIDPVAAWEANFRAAGQAATSLLDSQQQATLRRDYLRALEEAWQTDRAATARGDVLFVLGSRP